ncbi:hypothetical protein [Gloeobacter kilaueensis]|uniref:Uncharacterized protein n=1 Tax=Gloeobacter kilaueensis (strain ATCC BAA-2537 / CCAP 1431/1 / ULC 316 / JS1) TaxID=1183438 RepID=U5QKN3_GLOK1|nr:hypothetical protein [Gloeobacter kilaueensis]AGY59418.1 hypothetical protein GKIL_3172 [Gloeobacter kilaueensis JS1]
MTSWIITAVLPGAQLPKIIRAGQQAPDPAGVTPGVTIIDENDVLYTHSSLVELRPVNPSSRDVNAVARLDQNSQVTLQQDGPAMMLKPLEGNLFINNPTPAVFDPTSYGFHTSSNGKCIPDLQQIYLVTEGQSANHTLYSLIGDTNVYGNVRSGGSQQYLLAGTVAQNFKATYNGQVTGLATSSQITQEERDDIRNRFLNSGWQPLP